MGFKAQKESGQMPKQEPMSFKGSYKGTFKASLGRKVNTYKGGRIDDVIKVSGYRLGTAEIESALVRHPQVAEAAAIALPHELKEMLSTFM